MTDIEDTKSQFLQMRHRFVAQLDADTTRATQFRPMNKKETVSPCLPPILFFFVLILCAHTRNFRGLELRVVLRGIDNRVIG